MKVVVPSQFETGYIFSPKEIQEATTPEYRAFLKEAGYVDLKKTPNLFIANHLLRADDRVAREANRAGIKIDYTGSVNNINQENALALVHCLGGRVLTSNFMYGLFIPNLRLLAEQGDLEAKATLEEMTDMAEFLEDLITDGNKVKIGNGQKDLKFVKKDGYFTSSDLNEFGYPNAVRSQGEFRYWCPSAAENVVVRGRGSGLGLGCDWGPSDLVGGLGVRFAKFF